MKHCVMIEFLTAEGCTVMNICRRMTAVYDGTCVDASAVMRWAKTAKDENPASTILNDYAGSG